MNGDGSQNDASTWDVQQVTEWLERVGLSQLKRSCEEEQIDGSTLLILTERMTERLSSNMKIQCKFLQELETLRKNRNQMLATGHTQPSTSAQDETIAATPLPISALAGVIRETTEAAQFKITTHGKWPILYELPDFPPAVAQALARKDKKLVSKEKNAQKNALITCLFNQITRYTWWPDSQEYNEVMSCLILKYPFLRDTSASGFQCLKACLITKFKHGRKPLTSDPMINFMRAKFGGRGGGRKRNHPDDQQPGEIPKQFRPATQELTVLGEDQHSLEKHEEFLVSEAKKSTPRLDLMMATMGRTVKSRNEAIPDLTTVKAMETFPYLQIPELLLHDVKLRYGKELLVLARTTLDPMVDRLLEKARSKPKSQEIKQMLDFISRDDIPLSQDAKRNAALVVLPSLLAENFHDMFLHDVESQQPYPTVQLKGGNDILSAHSFVISADGCVLVTSDNGHVLQAVACVMGVYWTYQYKYKKTLKRTMSFLDHYIFELNSTKSIPMPAVRLKNELTNI